MGVSVYIPYYGYNAGFISSTVSSRISGYWALLLTRTGPPFVHLLTFVKVKQEQACRGFATGRGVDLSPKPYSP